MSIRPELARLLVCPACRGTLNQVELPANPGETALHCRLCSLAYPVRDGIPVMLTEEAVSTVNMTVTPLADSEQP